MKKVVIMGAGPAGLTCAYNFLKNSNDYEVYIIEENKQVGGISKTVKYKGSRMDLGGHRFFSKNKEINNIWQEILPLQGKPSYDDKILKRRINLKKGGPNPEKDDKVLLVRNRVSRILYNRKFFSYPINISFNTFKNLGIFSTIICGLSYFKSILIKKKEKNLEDFYINRFGNKLYSMFFKDYTEKVWGRNPNEISSSWGRQRVKGLNIIVVLKDSILRKFNIKNNKKETSLIENFYYPKYGPGQMWETMAKEIKKMGGKIIKNAKVVNIYQKNYRIKYVDYIIDGKIERIKADYFVSSLALKDLVTMMNDVDKKAYSIATKLPYRSFITLGIVAKKINLKNETNIKTINNIVPDSWIYIQENDVKMGRIQVFNNWSSYLVDDVKNTISLGIEYFCDEDDKLWNMSNKEFTNFVIKELEKINILSKDDIINTHVERVKKAYPAYFDSYKDIDKLIRYLNRYDNLYCIGRNGQHRYNNMDHSMLTGLYASNNIINNIKDKSNIWNVNVLDEYLEKGDDND